MLLYMAFLIKFKCNHGQNYADHITKSSVVIVFSVRLSRSSLHACIPSLYNMLGYREATSRITRIAPVGISLSE